jgi:hypothetical protein
MRTRLMQPLASVLGDPMLRNGYALIVSATVTQILGGLYWIVAARTAPALGGPGRPPSPAGGRLVCVSHIYLPSRPRHGPAEEGP